MPACAKIACQLQTLKNSEQGKKKQQHKKQLHLSDILPSLFSPNVSFHSSAVTFAGQLIRPPQKWRSVAEEEAVQFHCKSRPGRHPFLSTAGGKVLAPISWVCCGLGDGGLFSGKACCFGSVGLTVAVELVVRGQVEIGYTAVDEVEGLHLGPAVQLGLDFLGVGVGGELLRGLLRQQEERVTLGVGHLELLGTDLAHFFSGGIGTHHQGLGSAARVNFLQRHPQVVLWKYINTI